MLVSDEGCEVDIGDLVLRQPLCVEEIISQWVTTILISSLFVTVLRLLLLLGSSVACQGQGRPLLHEPGALLDRRLWLCVVAPCTLGISIQISILPFRGPRCVHYASDFGSTPE